MTTMHELDEQLQLMLKGEFEKAWQLSEKLEKIGPDEIRDPSGQKNQEMWVRHCFNRGWFFLQKNQYQEGCQLLESGRFISVYGNGPLKTTAPIYNPKEHSLRGKNLIISLEGGYGDEIIHARFASSFKKAGAAKVFLAADPILHSVFSRIEGVDGCITRAESNTVAHDFWVPGFSAGWLAGHTFDDLPGKPYLTPNPASVQAWENMIVSDKKKVGIRWAGNPKFEHQQFRRFPEEFILELAKYDDVQIYSLQRDNNIIDLPNNIIDLQHMLISWEDTMAAIANLDIVISSCTSVAHLAAAMGKETWVITPILPYHTWTLGAPESTTSPYYDCVRLFRQQEQSKWNKTFQDLYAAFEKRFDLPHIDHPNHDRPFKKLNLGCGFKKFDDFHNVDASPLCEPDEVVELNSKTWPWKDNEYSHIVAKDILEHLGHSGVDFTDIIKEMYRISDNGAVWEVQAPHWYCDIAYDDPSHVRVITPGTWRLFNRKMNYDKIVAGESDSYLSFLHGVDIELVDMKLDYNPHFMDNAQNNNMSESEVTFAVNHYNNVVQSVKYLIQVHKPPRYNEKELKDALDTAKSKQ
jgi:hypothetical protein